MSSGLLSRLRSGAAQVGGHLRGRQVEVKTADEIDAMRAAGVVVADALAAVHDAAQPGTTTAQLDAVADGVIRAAGAVPSFLGYLGFPASICASVNDRVVHGIPSPATVLADGDLVSIDCGAILDGWHGDAAITVEVGVPRPEDRALSEACRSAMWAGIAALRPGGRLGDVSHAVESEVRRHTGPDGKPYGIIEEYGGHGIGTAMHMEPFLPNTGRPGTGLLLRTGMVLAVEPMLTRGAQQTHELSDEWTVVTTDGSRAAHWEHSVAVTADAPRVLTAPRDG